MLRCSRVTLRAAHTCAHSRDFTFENRPLCRRAWPALSSLYTLLFLPDNLHFRSVTMPGLDWTAFKVRSRCSCSLGAHTFNSRRFTALRALTFPAFDSFHYSFFCAHKLLLFHLNNFDFPIRDAFVRTHTHNTMPLDGCNFSFFSSLPRFDLFLTHWSLILSHLKTRADLFHVLCLLRFKEKKRRRRKLETFFRLKTAPICDFWRTKLTRTIFFPWSALTRDNSRSLTHSLARNQCTAHGENYFSGVAILN